MAERNVEVCDPVALVLKRGRPFDDHSSGGALFAPGIDVTARAEQRALQFMASARRAASRIRRCIRARRQEQRHRAG